MFSPIEEIKSRIDIVELVQGYMRLQKSGVNYKATCPFHSEKTPSFYVTPSRQIWHCFGCGKGGDIFKFVMEIDGHDFPEALRLLAARAGVTLTREDPTVRSERNRLYDICEEATKIFERSLLLTPAVKTYLKKRAVIEETVRKFRIGFAPQSWDHLIRSLAKKGFKKEEIEKAGLAARSEDKNSWYDRFRSRIMFPIADGNGKIIGFGGRIFSADRMPSSASVVAQGGSASSGETSNPEKTEAKYVNTPATPIYDKSKILYGFDKAKQEIRKKDCVVIVEGYMDCILSHQAGVENTVAISGTALTPFQLKTMRRLTGTIISSFDTDMAGDSATKRSLALALEYDFVRKIARIPSGKDPADAVCENPALWVKATEEAQDVVSFYFDKAFRDYTTERADGKKAIAALVLPYVRELTDEIEKAHWVSELAKRLGTPDDAIWKELQRKRPNPDSPYRAREEEEKVAPTRRQLLEEQFLSLLSLIHERKISANLDFSRITFTSALHMELFQFLTGGVSGELNSIHHSALATLQFKGELSCGADKDIHDELKNSARELEKVCIKEKLIQVGGEIKKLEQEGIHRNTEPLLKTFRELSVSLNNLA